MYYWFILLSPIMLIIESLTGNNYIQYIAFGIIILYLLRKKIFFNLYVFSIMFIFGIQFVVFKNYYRDSFNNVTLIRWGYFMLNMYILTKRKVVTELKEFLELRKNKILIIAIICLIIEFISIFNGGMRYHWEGKAFYGVFASPHNNSYFLLVIQFMLMYSMIKQTRFIKQNIINVLIIFTIGLNLLTAARVSTLVAMFVYGLFIIKYCNKNIISAIMISFMIIISILIILQYDLIDLNNIPLLQKFQRQERVGNVLSSRDRIWNAQITYYLNYNNILQMIFGNYFGISVLINSNLMGESIWAHNDILEVLVSIGVVGVVLYLYPCYVFVKTNKQYVLTGLIMILAIWNGFMNYVQISIFIPVIFIFYYEYKQYFSKENRRNVNEKT